MVYEDVTHSIFATVIDCNAATVCSSPSHAMFKTSLFFF